jgi:hypothetical protein
MTKTRHLFAVALASCIATPASAGIAYLARAGSGTTCTLAAPCNSMNGAISAAGAAGEVICLDKGKFGAAFITQSVTISCGDDLWEVLAEVVSIFNLPAGSSVSIEGLVMDGNGSIGTAFTFNGEGDLRLHRVRIGNNPGANSDGLLFAPSGRAWLHVSDSIFYNNGTNSGGGIVIKPQSGGSAQVELERVTVNSNAFGIAADGAESTAAISMTIADSTTAGNSQDGILATTPSGGAPIGIYIKNTKSVNNAFGIRSIGPNVTVRVDGSSIIGNTTDLSFSSGGALLTFGNNAVRTSGSDGAFSGPVTRNSEK